MRNRVRELPSTRGLPGLVPVLPFIIPVMRLCHPQHVRVSLRRGGKVRARAVDHVGGPGSSIVPCQLCISSEMYSCTSLANYELLGLTEVSSRVVYYMSNLTCLGSGDGGSRHMTLSVITTTKEAKESSSGFWNLGYRHQGPITPSWEIDDGSTQA
jgi:hypothetical protein